MPHPLTAHLFGCHVNAALLTADNLSVVVVFVLSAHAGAVFGRAENALAEQAANLGFKGSIVNGFGLDYFAV